MSIFRRKKQTDAETESLKSFLDMIAPSIVKFETGYYICGNTFRCIWALREYPTSTDDLAILRHIESGYSFWVADLKRFNVSTKVSSLSNSTYSKSFSSSIANILCLTTDNSYFNHNQISSSLWLL